MSQLKELVADLEAAPKGSPELNDRLLLALGWRVEEPVEPKITHRKVYDYINPEGRNTGHFGPIPTQHIGYAFEMIPDPWWLQNVGHVEDDRYGAIEACLAFKDSDTLVFGRGADYPLAICVAIAKALASS